MRPPVIWTVKSIFVPVKCVVGWVTNCGTKNFWIIY